MRDKRKICKPFNKLKGLMREKGYSQQKLATEIGISGISINRKLNGKTAFQWPEIDKIVRVLDISDAEIGYYFFGQVLRKRNVK